MTGFASDHPTYADCLGREKLLLEVAAHAKSCRPPQVIGIYGDWGSGKTSFLRSLQLYLEGPSDSPDVTKWTRCFDASPNDVDEKHSDDWYEGKGLRHVRSLPGAGSAGKVVWFEAWRYQGEEAPIIALLHEIRRQFGPGTKAWEMLKKDARIALDSSLLALDPIAKAIAQVEPAAGFAAKGVSNIYKAAERVERERYEIPLSSDEIRRHLGEAVKNITKSFSRDCIDPRNWRLFSGGKKAYLPPNRLTIIIDDLDRCEPAMALRLLEGIKLFFNIDNCVFVLGVNSKRLTDHVAQLYGLDESKDSDQSKEHNSIVRHAARDYLDKIINSHFWLGLLQRPDEVLKRHMPQVVCTVNEDELDLTERLRNLIAQYEVLPPNPRKIKGFLSTLSRYHGRMFAVSPHPALLILFAYLHQFNPDILRKLLFHEKYGPRFQEWCRTGIPTEIPELKDMKSLVTFATDEEAKGKESFPDPIYDQVLLVQRLVGEWDEDLDPSKIDFTPYSLFG